MEVDQLYVQSLQISQVSNRSRNKSRQLVGRQVAVCKLLLVDEIVREIELITFHRSKSDNKFLTEWLLIFHYFGDI